MASKRHTESTLSGPKKVKRHSRPIIVRFHQHRDKLAVLNHRAAFKEASMGVSNDLTMHQRQQLRELRQEGITGFFKNGSLQTAAPHDDRYRNTRKVQPIGRTRQQHHPQQRQTICSSEDHSLPVPSSRYTFNTNRQPHSRMLPRQTRPENHPREQFHPNDNPSHIVSNPRANPPHQRYPDGKRKNIDYPNTSNYQRRFSPTVRKDKQRHCQTFNDSTTTNVYYDHQNDYTYSNPSDYSPKHAYSTHRPSTQRPREQTYEIHSSR
ncbi:hypothetical protein ElyMa_000259200 [Elysia marginata]|uniref:Uncharacterized protein n=1 Tax=Elysia marginata TaxID=1093978 RepID=A0AAV4F5X7_9GAST|nr:hypothetical protein ElyMa_000259200 [Elysia marginata]